MLTLQLLSQIFVYGILEHHLHSYSGLNFWACSDKMSRLDFHKLVNILFKETSPVAFTTAIIWIRSRDLLDKNITSVTRTLIPHFSSQAACLGGNNSKDLTSPMRILFGKTYHSSSRTPLSCRFKIHKNTSELVLRENHILVVLCAKNKWYTTRKCKLGFKLYKCKNPSAVVL